MKQSKKAICVMALAVFCLHLNLSAQNISLRIKDTTVKEAMETLKKEYNYSFIFESGDVDTQKRISVDIQDQSLENVVKQILKDQDLSYEIKNRNIIVSRNSTTGRTTAVQKTISGIIVDANGEPVIGANVVEKGTTNGIITNMEGEFSLTMSSQGILQISYIGYLTQELPVANRITFRIVLQEDTKTLEEVVVIGYGTQRKGEVSSAIATVRADDFIKGAATADAAQMIRGQIAGLSIISPDASPTSKSQVRLRGVTTLMASASPLILIDGVPGDLDTVSPDEIEQIDVLKDGSAAAIYGTRGTNGVILVTTKSARLETPPSIEVNTYWTTQTITRKMEFMSAGQYRELAAAGKPGARNDGSSTNWLDEVLQTPFTQVYNISLKGGGKYTGYVASFEYRDMNGLIRKSENRVIYPRLEINHRMFDNKLRITAGVNGSSQQNSIGPDSEIYRNALMYNPTTPIKDAEGNWIQTPGVTAYSNPLALLHETPNKAESTRLRAFSSIYITPLEGLDLHALLSTDTYNRTEGSYETSRHMSTYESGRNGVARRKSYRIKQDMMELTAQYNRTVKEDHSFTVLGGYSWMKENVQMFEMMNYGFPSDDYLWNNMGVGSALTMEPGRATMGSEQSENLLIGFFGRLNYSYKGRYMLSASLRHEGSSKFGKNHKWGSFPSLSAAWNIAEEDFLSDILFLTVLKLRAGYGITGTVPEKAYLSQNKLNLNTYGYNGEWIRILRADSNSNPDLKWEKKKETNVGVDFGFWENRFSGSVDYYYRKTEDLLWNYTVPVPPYQFPEMIANGGSIRNQGVEIVLSGIPVETTKFRWNTSVNYSTNKNKLLSLSGDQFISADYSDVGSTGEPMQQRTHRVQEGQPIGNFYGYKAIDISSDGYWIILGQDGNPKPIDQQQPDDKYILGNGLPKHYLNWNNTITWKDFALTVTMRGAFGFDILNMSRLQYEPPVMLGRGNVFADAYHDVFGKRPLADDQSLQYVDYYIEKGDYWKIDNLSFSYTLKLKNPILQQVRLYANVSNLAVITGYKGIDPEVSYQGNDSDFPGLTPGMDNKSRYPAARTYTFGLSFKF